MTQQKSFKERIRARMDKTGESYTTARRRLIEKAEAGNARPQVVAPARMSDDSVLENTGRSYEYWFTLLDGWGATDRKHPEIARRLVEEQGVPGWWAQNLTVSYEQERGMRAPGQRADGTYSVTASKTVNVPVEKLYQACHHKRIRAKWLRDHELDVRTARPPKTFTAKWEDGSTRLVFGFTPKGPNKSQVGMAHEKIMDPKRAEELKAFWRDRMKALKELLEG